MRQNKFGPMKGEACFPLFDLPLSNFPLSVGLTKRRRRVSDENLPRGLSPPIEIKFQLLPSLPAGERGDANPQEPNRLFRRSGPLEKPARESHQILL